MCEPNLERFDLFASTVQPVEDFLGVRERAIVAAAEAREREYLAEQVSGNRLRHHWVNPAGSTFPNVGHAFAPT